MRKRLVIIPILLAGAVMTVVTGDGPTKEPAFTTDFSHDLCQSLVPSGSTQYISLKPGRFMRYEGVQDGDFLELEVTVLSQTRQILHEVNGEWKLQRTRAVEEREWINGQLAEVTLNYLARCPKSDNVYYFGEDVDIYEDGVVVSHDGTWLAGVDGAKAGLLIPGQFLLGARYHMELAPGVSMDRAENMEMGLVVETPAGTFENCILVLETTPIEPDEESIKIYVPGFGLIVDDYLELVDYGG